MPPNTLKTSRGKFEHIKMKIEQFWKQNQNNFRNFFQPGRPLAGRVFWIDWETWPARLKIFFSFFLKIWNILNLRLIYENLAWQSPNKCHFASLDTLVRSISSFPNSKTKIIWIIWFVLAGQWPASFWSHFASFSSITRRIHITSIWYVIKKIWVVTRDVSKIHKMCVWSKYVKFSRKYEKSASPKLAGQIRNLNFGFRIRKWWYRPN